MSPSRVHALFSSPAKSKRVVFFHNAVAIMTDCQLLIIDMGWESTYNVMHGGGRMTHRCPSGM